MRSIDMNREPTYLRAISRSMFSTLVMVAMAMSFTKCGSGKKDEVHVATIQTANPSVSATNLSINEIADLMKQFSRLSDPEYSYEYIHAQVISFPVKPDHFAYFLEVSAKVLGHDSKPIFSSYKLYVELSQNRTNLYFNPDNFQQACSSTTCDDCRLIMYQNGGFGCDCSDDSPESPSDCSYEKSRVLTNKQQKSDII